MKKIIINVILILIAFVIYFLQSNFFNWFNIAGVKPNLFVIYILFIGLFGHRGMGITYGAVYGIILDFLFKERIGAYLLGLTIVGVIATIFEKNFSKNSRITIMVMVIVSTIIFEIIMCILDYILYSTNIEIVKFVQILIIEILYNTVLSIIIYPAIQKFGYTIENEYKGNRILTKYF